MFLSNQIEFLFHEDSQETGVWEYCGVWNYGAVRAPITQIIH